MKILNNIQFIFSCSLEVIQELSHANSYKEYIQLL